MSTGKAPSRYKETKQVTSKLLGVAERLEAALHAGDRLTAKLLAEQVMDHRRELDRLVVEAIDARQLALTGDQINNPEALAMTVLEDTLIYIRLLRRFAGLSQGKLEDEEVG